MDPSETVDSVGSFVQVLRDLGAAGLTRPLWFRGHQDSAYRLQASALREERFRDHEAAMVKRFIQDCHPMLPEAPVNTWEWLFLAQHHGVPTRLLDWSENALIGLYFACEPRAQQIPGTPQPDGDVWILMPEKLNSVAGTWSALHGEDLPLLGMEKSLDKYNPMGSVAPQEPLKHVAAIAARSFPRIISQWGTFTVTGEHLAMEDIPGADTFLLRIRVEGGSKNDILQELSSLGVEERVVYPDLHRLGRRVKELFS